MAGERIKGETPLGYEYFLLYLKQDEPRSIDPLTAIEVLGKKRSQSAIANYSTNNKWASRAETWDIKKTIVSIADLFRGKRDEIGVYLDAQLEIGQQFQYVVRKAMAQIIDDIDGVDLDGPKYPDPKHVRQWAMTYDTAGKWIGNLVGAFDKALQDNDAQ